jgi:hypothetical protein
MAKKDKKPTPTPNIENMSKRAQVLITRQRVKELHGAYAELDKLNHTKVKLEHIANRQDNEMAEISVELFKEKINFRCADLLLLVTHRITLLSEHYGLEE